MDLRRSEESRITYMKCMKLMTSRNSSFLYLGFLKKNLLRYFRVFYLKKNFIQIHLEVILESNLTFIILER